MKPKTAGWAAAILAVLYIVNKPAAAAQSAKGLGATANDWGVALAEFIANVLPR